MIWQSWLDGVDKKSMKSPEKIAKQIAKKQKSFLKACKQEDPERIDRKYFLLSIEKNGLLKIFTCDNNVEAVEGGKVLWQNEVAAVSVFYFTQSENSILIQTIYWGLRIV